MQLNKSQIYTRNRKLRNVWKSELREIMSEYLALKKEAGHLLDAGIKGGLIKREPCEVCGLEKSEGHHYDYTKPLFVQWLCRKHHIEEHMKLGKPFAHLSCPTCGCKKHDGKCENLEIPGKQYTDSLYYKRVKNYKDWSQVKPKQNSTSLKER